MPFTCSSLAIAALLSSMVTAVPVPGDVTVIGFNNVGACAVDTTIDPGNAWVNVGAAKFLDDFITSNGPSNLDQAIDKAETGSSQSTFNCQNVGDVDNCKAPSGCEAYNTASIFFIQEAFANFHSYLNQFKNALVASTLINSLDIDSIVADFPAVILTQVPSTLDTVAGAILGLLGSGSGFFPESDVASHAGAFASVVSGLLDASAPSDASDQISGVQEAIESQLTLAFQSFSSAIDKLAQQVFSTGQVTAASSDFSSPNNEVNNVAQYFAGGKFLNSVPDFSSISDGITKLLTQNLVGVALSASNVYILKGAHNANDCFKIAGSRQINGICYTLEVAGPGTAVNARPAQTDNTKPLESSVAVLIDTKYGISPLESTFYVNAEDCVNSSGYSGSIDTTGQNRVGGYPRCFFNIPVLTVPEGGSPCDIAFQQKTDGQAGVDFLPDDLKDVFGVNGRVCSPPECKGRNC